MSENTFIRIVFFILYSNYFWSDSRQEGFGFELEVVSPGDKFTMYDDAHNLVGNCEVIDNKVLQPFKAYFGLLFPCLCGVS